MQGGEEKHVERDLLLDINRPATRKITATQYAHVSVYDLQRWFENSALAAADDDQITRIKAQIESLEAVAATAAQTLGEHDPKTLDYQEQLADAQNLLRLARVNQAVEAWYEPLSAKLSYGFVGQDLGNGVVTGLIAWISTKPWDNLAVGRPLNPDANNPDPQRPMTGPIDGIEGDKLVHPFASPYTLMVAEAPLGELTQESVGIPWQPSALVIPESYFRHSMAATLAASMDAKWREKREEEDLQHEQDGTTPDYQVNVGQQFALTLPEGSKGNAAGLSWTKGLLSGKPTTPGMYEITVNGEKKTLWIREAAPSRTWDGRWYFHVAAWWSAVWGDFWQPS